MKEVSFREQILRIGDAEIEFEDEIHDVLPLENLVLVCFKKGVYDPENLMAYNYSGDRMWRVDTIRNQVSGRPDAISMVKEVDDQVVVFTTGSERYELDPATGEVEHLGSYK